MNAVQANLLIFSQITELLDHFDEPKYTRPLPIFHGSSLGDHFRHILEFYTCLLDGSPRARIDYSARKRNLVLSQKPKAALAVFEFLEKELTQLDENQWLNTLSELPDEADLDEQRPTYLSSMGRELQYAFDHAVHHLAIIRIGLELNFPEIPVSPDLGVAPSTVKFRQQKLPVAQPKNLDSAVFVG